MSYKDRQQSLKLLQAGYAESQVSEKLDEIKHAQAMQSVQLNEVEQKHPRMMMAAGYRVLDELNKPKLAETETTIQLGGSEVAEKDAELQEVENHLAEVSGMFSKMDEILEYLKQKATDEK